MKQALPRKPRHIGQKISLAAAVLGLLCAAISLGLSFWAWATYGKHVYTGSLFATTFFFFTAAIVLYEMSRPGPILPPAERSTEEKT